MLLFVYCSIKKIKIRISSSYTLILSVETTRTLQSQLGGNVELVSTISNSTGSHNEGDVKVLQDEINSLKKQIQGDTELRSLLSNKQKDKLLFILYLIAINS